jgi:hypothetical protein
MEVDSHVAVMRRRRSQLEANRAAIVELRTGSRSRFAFKPAEDKTNGWLARLDEQIKEQAAIIEWLEQRSV